MKHMFQENLNGYLPPLLRMVKLTAFLFAGSMVRILFVFGFLIKP
ncbi:hypothetical protein SMU109_09987 [Streptococcus mutans OMZ175]|nr:hypothetical protein SMU109_09987 [Streptococcus mutans OMZ175]